jgi:hypothetical protein
VLGTGRRLVGETSDKKPLRLAGTQTVDDVSGERHGNAREIVGICYLTFSAAGLSRGLWQGLEEWMLGVVRPAAIWARRHGCHRSKK